MLKKAFSRKAACLGLTATLVAGFTVTFIAPTAATICRELNLAGISLSLDKFTSENKDSIINSSVANNATGTSVTTEEPATASPATTAAVEATEKPEKKKKETDNEPKRVDRGLITNMDVKAISVAHDYVNVRKEPNTHSKIKGKLYQGCAAEILAKKGAWVKIQSGNVKGYIKKSYLAIGKDAKKLVGKYGQQYIRVQKKVITLNVREKQSMKSSIVTQIPEEESYDVLKETKGWYKILIDEDTKGFVKKEYVNLHVRFKKAISIKEEKAEIARKKRAERAQRERLAALERERAAANSSQSSNNGSYSGSGSSGSSSGSSGSSSSGSSGSSGGSSSSAARATGSTGSDIARYACNFVGNPYKWGGTSLTNGADCSGFTMSIYAQYGYSLPHSSSAQAGYGRSVSLSSVQPGDLIFYRHGSSIGHVAIYIGGGRVVHAQSARTGITTSGMYYNQPSCARRIVG